MIITCKAKDFIDCANMLKSVVPIKSPLPSITGILVKKDGPVMIANNMQTGMSVTFDAEVDLVGRLDGSEEAYIIPGRKTIDICNKLKVTDEDMLTLDCNDDKAILKVKKSRFTLNTLPAEQFPAFPAVPDTDRHCIPGDVLVKLLKSTVYAVSGLEATGSLCGVYLEGLDGNLTAIATNRQIFSVAIAPYDHNLEGVVIPEAFVKVMISTFQEGDVWLTIADNQLVCGQDDTVITSLLLAETYPAKGCKEVVETVRAYPNTTTCSKAELVNAVDMAVLLSDPKSPKIALSSTDVLNVTGSHDVGGAENIIDADVSGVMELSELNGSFVRNALLTLDGERIVMKYNSPTEVFLFYSEDDESVIGMISPINDSRF